MSSDLRSLSPSSLVSSAMSHAVPRRRNLDLESEAGAAIRSTSPAIVEPSNVPDDVFTENPKLELTRKQKANQKKHQQARKRARLKIIRKILTQGYRKSQVEFLLARAQLRALSQQNALGLEGIVQPETQEILPTIARSPIVPEVGTSEPLPEPIKTGQKRTRTRKRARGRGKGKKIDPLQIPLPSSRSRTPSVSSSIGTELAQFDYPVVSHEKVKSRVSTPVLPTLGNFSPHGEVGLLMQTSPPQSVSSKFDSPLDMPFLQLETPPIWSNPISQTMSPMSRSANSSLTNLILPQLASPSVLSELEIRSRSTSPKIPSAHNDVQGVSSKRALKAQYHEARTQDAIQVFLEQDALKIQKQLDAITVGIADLEAKKLKLNSLIVTETRQQAIANIRTATMRIKEDIARLEAAKLEQRNQALALLQVAANERLDALKQVDLSKRDQSITVLRNATNERQAKIDEGRKQASLALTNEALRSVLKDLQEAEKRGLAELSLKQPMPQKRESLDTVSSDPDTASVKTIKSDASDLAVEVVEEPEEERLGSYSHSPSQQSISMRRALESERSFVESAQAQIFGSPSMLFKPASTEGLSTRIDNWRTKIQGQDIGSPITAAKRSVSTHSAPAKLNPFAVPSPSASIKSLGPLDMAGRSPLPEIKITTFEDPANQAAYGDFQAEPSANLLGLLLEQRKMGVGTEVPQTPSAKSVVLPSIESFRSLPNVLPDPDSVSERAMSDVSRGVSEIPTHFPAAPFRTKSKPIFTVGGSSVETSPALSSAKLSERYLPLIPASPLRVKSSLINNDQLLQVPPSPIQKKLDWTASSQGSLSSLGSFLTPEERIRWDENKLKASQGAPIELNITSPQPEVVIQPNQTSRAQAVRRVSQLNLDNPFAPALARIQVQTRDGGNFTSRYPNRGDKAMNDNNWRDRNRGNKR